VVLRAAVAEVQPHHVDAGAQQPLEHGRLLSLYDVESDPGCTADVASRHPAEVERLWAQLRAWMANDPALRGDLRLDLPPTPATASAARAPETDLVPEVR